MYLRFFFVTLFSIMTCFSFNAFFISPNGTMVIENPITLKVGTNTTLTACTFQLAYKGMVYNVSGEISILNQSECYYTLYYEEHYVNETYNITAFLSNGTNNKTIEKIFNYEGCGMVEKNITLVADIYIEDNVCLFLNGEYGGEFKIDCDGHTIRGNGNNGSFMRYGIAEMFDTYANYTIENCNIDGFEGGVVAIFLKINNTNITNFYYEGIYSCLIWGENVVVKNFTGISGYGIDLSNCYYVPAGDMFLKNSYFEKKIVVYGDWLLFENNTFLEGSEIYGNHFVFRKNIFRGVNNVYAFNSTFDGNYFESSGIGYNSSSLCLRQVSAGTKGKIKLTNNIFNCTSGYECYALLLEGVSNNEIYNNYFAGQIELRKYEYIRIYPRPRVIIYHVENTTFNTTPHYSLFEKNIVGGCFIGGNYYTGAYENYSLNCVDVFKRGICDSPLIVSYYNFIEWYDYAPLSNFVGENSSCVLNYLDYAGAPKGQSVCIIYDYRHLLPYAYAFLLLLFLLSFKKGVGEKNA